MLQHLPLDAATFLSALPDAVTIHAPDGTILYASPAIERLTGFSPDELVGLDPFASGFFHPADTEQVSDIVANRQPGQVTYRLRRSDGTHLWVESTGTPLDTPEGFRLVAITRNATGQHSLIQALEYERALQSGLRALEDRRQEFLTAISHRTRGPLTSVVGFAQLLRALGDSLDPQRRDQIVERLAAAAERLRNEIERVVEVERLAAADVAIDPQAVALDELVADVLERVGATGTVNVSVREGTRVVADPEMLTRALEALVTNAITHTPIGTDIWVRLQEHDDTTTIVVEDDGPGIAAEDRDRLFEPFERGDPDCADPGFGLGLYIASEVASLHSGELTFTERDGGGACFRLELPRSAGIHPQRYRATDEHLPPDAHRFVVRLLGTVRRELGMQVAYVSIFTPTEQVVVAHEGDGEALGIVRGRRFPLGETYCARMVRGEVDPVVADTSQVPELAGLAPTLAGIGSYMGVPLYLPDGHVIGSVCCADVRPRPGMPRSRIAVLETAAKVLRDQLGDPTFMDTERSDRLERIRSVITDPELVTIVYQPIIDVRAGSVSGVEALARFPDGGHRPTDLWFADAAQVGLLPELERCCLERSLEQAPGLPEGTFLALNLSPQTITELVLDGCLAGVPLDQVVLEVTEQAQVGDYGELRAALRPLRDRGLRLAIDDVGSGFASLRHVLMMQPDIVKIDRMLVCQAASDPQQHAVAVAFGVLADRIGADLIGEGVEDHDTLRALIDAGITHAQGWLFGRPSSSLRGACEQDVSAIFRAPEDPGS